MIFLETNIHPVVSDAEFKRLLRLPPHYEMKGLMAENAAWAREWFSRHAQPWMCAHPIDSCSVGDGVVTLDGQELHSKELAKRFRHAKAAVIVAASAGAEPEAEAAQRWADDEPDRYFFMETYATAVVESLIAAARGRLCPWADQQQRVLLPHYSPGYRGWSPADQHKVHGLVRQGGKLPGLLEILDSGMLRPKKSQLAVFAVAPEDVAVREQASLIPCKHCAEVRCEFRREPYALTG